MPIRPGSGLAADEEVAHLRRYLQVTDDVPYFGAARCVLAGEVGASVNEPGKMHLFAAMICFVGDQSHDVEFDNMSGGTEPGAGSSSPEHERREDISGKLLREFHLDELLQPELAGRYGNLAVRLSAVRGGEWLFTEFDSPEETYCLLDVLFRRRRQKGLNNFEDALWHQWLRDGDAASLTRELMHRPQVLKLHEEFGLRTAFSAFCSGETNAPVERLQGYWEVGEVAYAKAGATARWWKHCSILLTKRTLCVVAHPKVNCIARLRNLRGEPNLRKCWPLDQVVVVRHHRGRLRVRAEWAKSGKKGAEWDRAGELIFVFSKGTVGENECARAIQDAWYLRCAQRAEAIRCMDRRNSAPQHAARAPTRQSAAQDRIYIEVLRRLAQHFDSIDSRSDSRNGWVSRDTFLRAFGPLLQSRSFADAYFNIFQHSKKDQVNFVEFVAGMSDMLLGGAKDKLTLSFRLFDRDHDGFLNEAEFTAALEQLHLVSNAHLPRNQSLQEFARSLFARLSTSKAPGQPPTVSLAEYQRGMMNDAELHSAFKALGALVVDWKAQWPKAEKAGMDSTMAQAKAKAEHFVLFGHEDWGLVSHILHGIKRAVTLADRHARDEWLWGDSVHSPDFVPTAAQFQWLQREALRSQTIEVTQNSEVHVKPDGGTSSCFPCGGRNPLTFTDHAPQVCRRLREASGISSQEYVHSLGIDNLVFNLLLGSLCSLRQMSSSGQSGSFFFLSHDGKFILKSLPNEEREALLQILPTYALHMVRHPNTLITRFCGLYSLAAQGRPRCTFVAMTNVFNLPPGRTIRQLYDLKGSTINRSVPQEKRRDNVALKDLDLNRPVPLRWDWRERLLQQLADDSSFLCAHGLIDYSFLLGIDTERSAGEVRAKHSIANRALRELKFARKVRAAAASFCGSVLGAFCGREVKAKGVAGTRLEAALASSGEPFAAGRSAPQHAHKPSAGTAEKPPAASGISGLVHDHAEQWQQQEAQRRKAHAELGGGRRQADSVFTRHHGGIPTHDTSEVVYVGIIDILTQYNGRKRAEHRLKRITNPRMRMSCVPPDQYRDRFLNFLRAVLVQHYQQQPDRVVRLSPQLQLLQFHGECEAGLPVRLVLVEQGHECGAPSLVILTPVAQGLSAKLEEEVLVVREEYPLDITTFSKPLSLCGNNKLLVCPRPSPDGTEPFLKTTYAIDGGVNARHQLMANAQAIMGSAGAGAAEAITVSVCCADPGNRAALLERLDGRPLPDLVVLVMFLERGQRHRPSGPAVEPAVLLSHHCVAEGISGAVHVTVYLSNVLRGRATEVHVVSSDEVPGSPVGCALQIAETPLCIVATGHLDGPDAYSSAVAFVSCSLQLGGHMDIFTLFPFLFWATAAGEGQCITLPTDEVQELIKNQQWTQLWRSDRFATMRRAKQHFAGFSEAIPDYPPQLLTRRSCTPSSRLMNMTARHVVAQALIGESQLGPASDLDGSPTTMYMDPNALTDHRIDLRAAPRSHFDGSESPDSYSWSPRLLWRCFADRDGDADPWLRLVERTGLPGPEERSCWALYSEFRLASRSDSGHPAARRPQRHVLSVSRLSYEARAKPGPHFVCLMATFHDGAVRTADAAALELHHGAASRNQDAHGETAARRWSWPGEVSLVPPGLEDVRPFLEGQVLVAQVRAPAVWVTHTEDDASEDPEVSFASVGIGKGEALVVDTTGQGVLPLKGLCDSRVHEFEIALMCNGLPAGTLRGAVRLRAVHLDQGHAPAGAAAR